MGVLNELEIFKPIRIRLALFLVSLISLCLRECVGAHCPRDRSRIARQLINQNFLSQFDYHGYILPTSCPLHPTRDMYIDNEQHKENDRQDRWSCNYCGKMFINENWLDSHFDNRHWNKVSKAKDAVCLNDHCDYLRCEVVSGAKKPSYWEQALCKQSELDELRRKCEATLKSCLPENLSGMKRHDFLDKLKKSTCSSLTCAKYWDNPIKEVAAHTTAAYIILTCVLVVGLVLYYLIAYTHFYSDPSLLTDDDGLIKDKRTHDEQRNHLQAPDGSTMRNRYGYAMSGT